MRRLPWLGLVAVLAKASRRTGQIANPLRPLRELGDRHHDANVLAHLGDTYCAVGDPQTARDAWRQALDILDSIGVVRADKPRLCRRRPAPHETHRPRPSMSSPAPHRTTSTNTTRALGRDLPALVVNDIGPSAIADLHLPLGSGPSTPDGANTCALYLRRGDLVFGRRHVPDRHVYFRDIVGWSWIGAVCQRGL